MRRTDQWVITIVVILILIQSCVLTIGSVIHKLSYLTSLFNLVAGLSILIYWIQKQIRIDQHIIEAREIMVLGFEIVMAGLALYSIITNQWNSWFRIVQYIFFYAHLLALLLFLIFMLFFKMNRLI